MNGGLAWYHPLAVAVFAVLVIGIVIVLTGKYRK